MASSNDRQGDWRRSFHLVCVAELLATFGFEVANPILPLYVSLLTETQVTMWSGLVFFARGAANGALSPVWGVLSDRFGRKIMVERAMLSAGIFMAAMGLIRNVQQLAVLSALQGALSGTVTAAVTFVVTIVPRQSTGLALGALQVAVYAGSSAGPLLGGMVADVIGYRAAFWISGGLLLIAALVVRFFVREPCDGSRLRVEEGASGECDTSAHSFLGRGLVSLLESRSLSGVLGVSFLTRLVTHTLMPILPLFVREIAQPDQRVALITGLMLGGAAAAGGFGSVCVGKLGDHFGYKHVLRGCLVSLGVFCVAQSFTTHLLWLVLSQIGSGFALGGALTAIRASLARLAADGREGAVYGVDGSVSAMAFALGPIIGGGLATLWGLRVTFLGAGGLAATATVVLLGLPDVSVEGAM